MPFRGRGRRGIDFGTVAVAASVWCERKEFSGNGGFGLEWRGSE